VAVNQSYHIIFILPSTDAMHYSHGTNHKEKSRRNLAYCYDATCWNGTLHWVR